MLQLIRWRRNWKLIYITRRKVKSVRNTLDIENAENVISDLQRDTLSSLSIFIFDADEYRNDLQSRYFLLFVNQRAIYGFFRKKKKKKKLRSSDKESRETTYANFTILIRDNLGSKIEIFVYSCENFFLYIKVLYSKFLTRFSFPFKYLIPKYSIFSSIQYKKNIIRLNFWQIR